MDMAPRLGQRASLMLAAVACAVLLLGCRTAPAPVSAVPADWPVQQGQAVWQPRRGAAEVTGDLTVAAGSPRDYLIEFSKPAIPLIRVWQRDGRWQLHTANGRDYRGAGAPPNRAWFHLASWLSGHHPPAPWRAERRRDDRTTHWQLENPRTGERLEGFVTP